MTAAIAMIGTACFGPYSYTSTGVNIIEEPVPTIPEIVPATRPTVRTNRQLKSFSIPMAGVSIPLEGHPIARKR
jgi:hypothetical protein